MLIDEDLWSVMVVVSKLLFRRCRNFAFYQGWHLSQNWLFLWWTRVVIHFTDIDKLSIGTIAAN